MPQLWGALRLPEGSGLYQAAGHPLRDNEIASDLAQTAVALQGKLCGRASFTESLPAVRARSRLTTRLRAELGCAVAEQQRCVSEAAAHYGASWPIVHAAFVEHVRVPLAAPLPPVKVLGIDETRRGKPVWAQDPDTKRWVLVADRWHTGFVDAAGTGGLLAQVEGRTSAAAIKWLNEQPATWRAGITHVTIDLSASYAKAVREALPDAVLVADRFHVVASGQRHAHPGPPTSHPREPWSARPQDRPGLGRPAPAADRTRALAPRNLCEDVELADRHRRRRGADPSGLHGQGGASQPCSAWPGPTPNATSSGPGWTASTSRPPRPTHPRCTAWPPPSRPGGRLSKRAS